MRHESDVTSASQPPSWRLIGFALSAGGAMLFAIKGVLIKLIYRHGIDATALLALRMLICVPIFAVVGAVEWRRMPVGRRPDARTATQASAVGILGYFLSSWLDFAGLQTLDAQTERLILFTYPFFVILFGRAIFKHPLRAHALAGAGLSYLGLFIMFAGSPTRGSPAMLFGGALVATAAITFALYQLFARELIMKCGPTLFTAIAMSAAGLAAIAAFVARGDYSTLGAPAGAWALIVALALFATVVPSFMLSAGTARIGAQGTAIIGTMSPIVTVGIAVAILGEPFGLPEAAGTACVLGGVGLFSWIESRAARRSAAQAAGRSA